MEYYKEKIDIEKVNLDDIDIYKLIKENVWKSGVYITKVIEALIVEKGYEVSDIEKCASEMEYQFRKHYDLGFGYKKAAIIPEKYEVYYKELDEKYNIEKYKDVLGNLMPIEKLDNDGKKAMQEYEKEKKRLELKCSIEVHNTMLDYLEIFQENIDRMFNYATEAIKDRKKEAKMSILKNQYVWTGIILCVIFIFVFWETWGPLTILIAPIGVLVLAIAVGLYNAGGRYRYGSKWDSMTPYEQGTQVKKDNFINSLNNKK